jgi:hypothetical protein
MPRVSTPRPQKQDRIVSITAAAPGWIARYTDDTNPNAFLEAPVAAWVVMQDDEGHTWVAGIEPSSEGWDGRPADEMGNFSCYARGEASTS